MTSISISAPSARAPNPAPVQPGTFDPAAWLSAFEAVGGAYTVTDRLNLLILVQDQTDEELSRCRMMISELAPEQAQSVRAHVQAAQLQVVGED